MVAVFSIITADPLSDRVLRIIGGRRHESESESISGRNWIKRYFRCKAPAGYGAERSYYMTAIRRLDAEELKHEFDEDARITIVLGELKRTDLLGVEMCVISPGIPLEAPFVGSAG